MADIREKDHAIQCVFLGTLITFDGLLKSLRFCLFPRKSFNKLAIQSVANLPY